MSCFVSCCDGRYRRSSVSNSLTALAVILAMKLDMQTFDDSQVVCVFNLEMAQTNKEADEMQKPPSRRNTVKVILFERLSDHLWNAIDCSAVKHVGECHCGVVEVQDISNQVKVKLASLFTLFSRFCCKSTLNTIWGLESCEAPDIFFREGVLLTPRG